MRAPTFTILAGPAAGTVAAALLLAMPASADQAASADATCRGVTATIVGSPGERLAGTPGDDVIVTNGAPWVEAGAGDDLVCATGSVPVPYSSAVTVLGGDGDDVLDSSGDTPTAKAHLAGGAGRDQVFTGAASDLVSAEDDTVAGQGADHVFVGTEGRPDSSTIDVGADSRVAVKASLPFTGTLRSAGGAAISFDRSSWPDGFRLAAIDNSLGDEDPAGTSRGELRLDGVLAASWSGFDRFDAYPGGGARVSFRGGRADEFLAVSARGWGPLDLGQGDDSLWLLSDDRTRRPVTGGPGRDVLLTYGRSGPHSWLALDLARGTLETGPARDRELVARPTAFEDATAGAWGLELRGTAGPNSLQWNGCRVRVDAGRGGDTVGWVDSDGPVCGEGADMAISGGRGDDRLVGGYLADRLYGGRGHDVADGGPRGDDTCVAEVRLRC